MSIPERGRSLLWVVDAAFALDDRAQVPGSELNTTGSFANLTVTQMPKFANLTPSYVVIVATAKSELPRQAERARVAARLRPSTVLFDDRALIRTERDAGGFRGDLIVEGLYLLEGRTVRYRYQHFSNAAWDVQGLTPLIREGAATFLRGGEPTAAPVAFSNPGSQLPKSLLTINRPTLMIRITGFEAQAPKDGLQLRVQSNSNSLRTEVLSKSKYSSGRFLLDALPKTLKKYSAQGVAVVIDDSQIANLRREFPEWRFLVADRPELRLQLFELASAVIDASGRVKLHCYIGFDATPNTALLENALESASR